MQIKSKSCPWEGLRVCGVRPGTGVPGAELCPQGWPGGQGGLRLLWRERQQLLPPGTENWGSFRLKKKQFCGDTVVATGFGGS